jgi:hypothetical protein
MGQWAYLQRTRSNIQDIMSTKNPLIFWFGGQLKSETEISFFADRAKNLLCMEDKKSSALEEKILNLINIAPYSVQDQLLVKQNIRMEVARAFAILKLVEAFVPNRRIFDFGAGCGIVNMVFHHDTFRIQDVISCDQIEFSRTSFLSLNEILPSEKKKYLYREEIFNFSDYNPSDVLLFRWSFDEFDETSKVRTLELIKKNKFENIVICGNKHSNQKIDIDCQLVLSGYAPVFAGGRPFDHGFIRIYKRADKKANVLYAILFMLQFMPGKKNKWMQFVIKKNFKAGHQLP